MTRLRNIGIVLAILLASAFALNFLLKTLWERHWSNRAIPTLHDSEISKHKLRYVSANDLEFAYLEAGQGPLVILIHGFPDSAESWDATIDGLAGAGFRAVAPFQRGYFPSEIPTDGDYSAVSLGRDVTALISALGEEQAYVVGHDWGASAAYSAANLEPEKVRKLVTLAIPHPRVIKPSLELLRRAPHFVHFQFGYASEWLAARNDFEYIDSLHTRWSPTWDVPDRQRDLIKKMFSQPGHLRAALGYYQALFSDSETDRALRRRITSVSTLTFAGDNDGAFDTVNGFSEMPAAFSNGYEFVLIKDAGHFLHREKPREFLSKLIQFLKE
jgi:pimeloyl-ACP methyl ester carboxylesterase